MSETGVPYSADEHRTSREPRSGAESDERACGDVIRVVPDGAPRAREAALLSALDACWQRPTVFVGTGAGAVSAVLHDSPTHLPARRTGGTAVELWRGVGRGAVFGPFVPGTLSVGLARCLSGALQRPGATLTGPLHTAPLLSALHDRPDRQQRRENALTGKVRSRAVTARVCRTTRTGKYLVPKAGRRTEPAPSIQDTVAEVCQAVLTGRITEDLRAVSRAGALVESGATAKSTTGCHRCAAEASGRRAGHRGSGTGSDPASSARPSNSAEATPTTSAATRAAAVSGASRRSRRSRREVGAGTRAS
ncbi:hypothetical protein ABZ299_27740 [Streptomyces sp. NPDC006184]|uniref:hypothetical protein n=1 Tax=Streptomyces sp. NPDC006184 TaxID=3155455 RepID=UPI00339E1B89